MRSVPKTMIIIATTFLAGCVTQPTGPSIFVMPGPNKPFEVYQRDVYDCQQFAGSQTQGGAEAANTHALGSALVGAALGAAIGGAASGGEGAAIGAAAGGTAGTLYGAGASQYSQYGLQQHYDNAYGQCMYAKGNQVRGYYAPQGPPPPPPPGWRPPLPRG